MALFTTPLCMLLGGSTHSLVPNTSDYVIIVTFDEVNAELMRADMREFLRITYGKVAGARAWVPLFEMGGGRWALHFLSNQVPSLHDRSGYTCVIAQLCHGSLIRVSGFYEPMKSPGLIPIMQAVQVCRAAQDNAGRLFEAYEAA